ncbi:MAG: hypothetical protein IT452_00800 [Planctomycetia bacterium]|nr:hypothetical protein [Planctomycetia bacterium]
MSPRGLSLAALALFLAPALVLAGPQEDLKKKRDAKYAEPWVTKFPWVTSYAKAKEQAKKDGKLIFAYFSRSYSP